MASTWAWISRRRERYLLKIYLDHLEAVKNVVEKALEAIRFFSKGDLEGTRKAYEEVFREERRADDVKQKLLDELARGMIHPIDREELIRLVVVSDDIADYAKSGVRRLLYLDPQRMPKELLAKIETITAKLLEQVKLAIKATEELTRDPRESIRLANSIERLEEEVDEIRGEAEEQALEMCREDARDCLVALRVIESMEIATDRAEDLGDVIRSIALLG